MLIEGNGPSTELIWFGGTGTVALSGVFGGAGIIMQASYDQGESWIDLASEDGSVPTFSEPFVFNFTMSPCRFRFSAADTTGPTEISVSVNPINASNRTI